MDLGMSELLVIGIVALIVIGPRDLPEMFRQLGRLTAKMRAMAREFNRAMEQAAAETGVKDVAADLKAVTSPKSLGLEAVKGAVDKFEKWDPIKNAAKPTSPTALGAKPLTPPPMPATPAPVATATAEAAMPAAPAVAPEAPAGLGPNTAALYQKKAAREAVLRESAEKLRAIEAGAAPPASAPTPPPAAPARAKAAGKPKVKAVAAAEGAAPAAPAAPRKPRQKKAPEA